MQQNKKKRTAKPIEDTRDIAKVRYNLRNRPRDLLLFDLVTQTGMRAKQILHLKVRDLIHLHVLDEFPVAQGKVNKAFSPRMNETIYRTFKNYIDQEDPAEDEFLFKSRKKSEPLSLPSVTRLVNGWFQASSLKGLTGVRTLRKTWEHHFKVLPKMEKTMAQDTRSKHVLKPVVVETTQEVVFKELLQAIVSGRIRPGEKLHANEIAKQMGISRLPVREALGRLEALGWVSTKKNRGSVVNEISEEGLKEILEIRLVIESMAAKKAALNRTEATIQRLESLHKQYVDAWNAHDVDKLLAVNKKFHHTLYRDAGMPILQILINYLWDRISPYLHILLRQTDLSDPQTDIRCHEEMLNAMKERDPGSVVEWLKADLNEAAHFIVKLFSIYRKPLHD